MTAEVWVAGLVVLVFIVRGTSFFSLRRGDVSKVGRWLCRSCESNLPIILENNDPQLYRRRATYAVRISLSFFPSFSQSLSDENEKREIVHAHGVSALVRSSSSMIAVEVDRGFQRLLQHVCMRWAHRYYTEKGKGALPLHESTRGIVFWAFAGPARAWRDRWGWVNYLFAGDCE